MLMVVCCSPDQPVVKPSEASSLVPMSSWLVMEAASLAAPTLKRCEESEPYLQEWSERQ